MFISCVQESRDPCESQGFKHKIYISHTYSVAHPSLNLGKERFVKFYRSFFPYKIEQLLFSVPAIVSVTSILEAE